MYVLKQTCRFKLQVCLSTDDRLLPPGIKRLNDLKSGVKSQFSCFSCCFLRTMFIFNVTITQLIYTCSKSTKETLGKGVNYVQS